MKGLKVWGMSILMALAVSVTGCEQEEKLTEPIHIAALNGPTGMGMVKLMEAEKSPYEITVYQSPDDIVGKVVSGEIDIACVPSNLAAILYAKTEKNIYLLGTNTLGTLFVVENGDTIHTIEDLKGKTILSSGQGSTPEYVLDKLLQGAGINPEQDVTVKFLANHTDVVTELVANPGTIALLPQPHVAIASAKCKTLQIALDFNEAWEGQEQTDLPMGVIIGSKDFVDQHPQAISSFLEAYDTSVTFVNEEVDEAAAMIAAQGIIPSEAIAKAAIPYSHIVFEEAAESKESLETFYGILKEVNPKAIGGNLPDEAFYYSK